MNKAALIITDDAANTRTMAKTIAASLADWRVTVVTAGDFKGTHLLPAALCFLGAEAPNPPSFTYLETMLGHINLAGRVFAFFAGSPQAAEYLRRITRDSEASLYPDLFWGEGDIGGWAGKAAALSAKKG
ncbi:MAG: hypothetical protein LBK77_03865 [Spirochaetaceae bacterium]|nr:hypothetical protein [Spirochaetaceae bacterium]